MPLKALLKLTRFCYLLVVMNFNKETQSCFLLTNYLTNKFLERIFSLLTVTATSYLQKFEVQPGLQDYHLSSQYLSNTASGAIPGAVSNTNFSKNKNKQKSLSFNNVSNILNDFQTILACSHVRC